MNGKITYLPESKEDIFLETDYHKSCGMCGVGLQGYDTVLSGRWIPTRQTLHNPEDRKMG